MGDRLKADIGMIRECSESLKKIRREFDKHGNPADGYMEDLGYEDLEDAFQDFSDTWNTTRGKLSDDLKKLAKYTHKAAEIYDKVDSKLADALRDAKKGGRK